MKDADRGLCPGAGRRIEGEPDDEQRDCEPDAGEGAAAEHLPRTDAARDRAEAQAHRPRKVVSADTDGLADDEAEDDAPGDGRGEGVLEEATTEVDAGVGERKQRHDDEAREGMEAASWRRSFTEMARSMPRRAE